MLQNELLFNQIKNEECKNQDLKNLQKPLQFCKEAFCAR